MEEWKRKNNKKKVKDTIYEQYIVDYKKQFEDPTKNETDPQVLEYLRSTEYTHRHLNRVLRGYLKEPNFSDSSQDSYEGDTLIYKKMVDSLIKRSENKEEFEHSDSTEDQTNDQIDNSNVEICNQAEPPVIKETKPKPKKVRVRNPPLRRTFHLRSHARNSGCTECVEDQVDIPYSLSGGMIKQKPLSGKRKTKPNMPKVRQKRRNKNIKKSGNIKGEFDIYNFRVKDNAVNNNENMTNKDVNELKETQRKPRRKNVGAVNNPDNYTDNI